MPRINPFEQLAARPGAEHCFEHVASQILRCTVPDAGRVKVYLGDGGVDSYSGTWGSAGELDVFQIKYFTSPWTNSQISKIRGSYNTAKSNPDYVLRTWTVIVPSDPAGSDLRWFDPWRTRQPHEIELVDGSRLEDLLSLPPCRAARNTLREWGVMGLQSETAFSAWVRITSHHHFPLVLNLWLMNTGDATARSLRMHLEHTETNSLAQSPDASWRHLRRGAMGLQSCNPWYLEYRGVLNPEESTAVLSIPFREIPGEISLRMTLTCEDQSAVTLSCRIIAQDINLSEVQRFYFATE